MKNLLLVTALLFLILPNIFGEIRNGYARDITTMKASLQGLKDILSGKKRLTAGERSKIKDSMRRITSYLTYHDITETLLNRFRVVSPELYREMDNLKDGSGRIVDVYVKFLPEETAGFASTGMVSLVPSRVDSTGCSSEYGESSASVKIRITNKALQVLAHEFGHLSYIIPNMITYVAYYKDLYNADNLFAELGHLHADPGGISAYRFEKRFRIDYVKYLKRNLPRDTSPLALILRTKRSIVKTLDDKDLSVVTSDW